MNSKYLLYSIGTALIIVGIYHLFAVGKYNYPEYKVKAGQVADTEVIAPFDFPVLKPATELESEKEQVLANMDKPYYVSDEPMFEALSAMDAIYNVLSTIEPSWDEEMLAGELKRAGYTFTPQSLGFAFRSQSRDKVYDTLRTKLSSLFRIGIHESMEDKDSLLVIVGEETQMLSIDRYMDIAEAREQFANATEQAKAFATELGALIIKPNLLINEDKLNELSQRRLGSLDSSEGVVLQNEVIIRKNARITPEEIRKLESLQEAYRNRNLRKSAIQEMLLTLGLLIYVFIIVSLANHYFINHSRMDKLPVADFLPLNLGFVALVFITSIINQGLGYNNLIIPYAMMALSAGILVSFEYGMLYSICSLLLISPFLNWETYTPVTLLLSTVACLMIIRRQNAWHEYLTIWFYLVISSVLVILSIAIYKSDPLVIILRSIGYGVISATISVGGMILIVPYYERKWNRATKQTLLELLDFNHPLLKKLATEAVGTYHHSLIVGNLTERAAEAIGANPLLARVGSYYHDIGKVINTDIFTENNEDSSDIHDSMEPKKSAELIRNHVAEGITLATKYRIPLPVIDIIKQHHGNSLIRFFYDKASKKGKPVGNQDYQYPGPRPQSKEAALVMLADIVESTTKAKQIDSEEDIARIIDDTIARLIKDKQFDEAPITMKDLAIVKESFIPVLESIYRKRLDYPEAKKDE